MDATEFPHSRRFVLALALLLIAPSVANAAEEQAKPSASGTLVFVPSAKEQKPAAKSGKFRAPVKAKKQSSSAKKKQSETNERQHVKKQTAKKVSKSEQIAQMLVHAHRLSQEAADEKQFNEIAAICSTAERLGAKGDQLEFSMQLHLWASNQRDNLRKHQLETQLEEDKTEQQIQAEEKLQVLRAELSKQKLRAQEAEQKLQSEQMARKLRSERIANQRETAKVVNDLRKQIIQLKKRAEHAEQELTNQRAVPLEPEPIDVFADTDIIVQERAELPQRLPTAPETQSEVVAESVDWEALHDEAVTFAEQGRFSQALQKFNRVIQLNPMYAKAFSNRATLHVQQGDLELAAKDYEQACMIDAGLLHALVGLGRTYHQLGRLEESLQCMNRCIELDAENAELHCSRADLHTDMGNYREALADYARTIDLAPEFAHAYRNGAWLLATCPDPRYRDSKNAIQGALQAIEFNYGERHIALDTLAAALASDGQFEEAARTIQEALQIAPNEAIKDYRDRLAVYRAHKPFFNQEQFEEEEVQTATFEISDR